MVSFPQKRSGDVRPLPGRNPSRGHPHSWSCLLLVAAGQAAFPSPAGVAGGAELAPEAGERPAVWRDGDRMSVARNDHISRGIVREVSTHGVPTSPTNSTGRNGNPGNVAGGIGCTGATNFTVTSC